MYLDMQCIGIGREMLKPVHAQRNMPTRTLLLQMHKRPSARNNERRLRVRKFKFERMHSNNTWILSNHFVELPTEYVLEFGEVSKSSRMIVPEHSAYPTVPYSQRNHGDDTRKT